MASAAADAESDDKCLMCFENPREVTVNPCHHAYCRSCLTKHAERSLHDGDTFPCPICGVMCPKQILTWGREHESHTAAVAARSKTVVRKKCGKKRNPSDAQQLWLLGRAGAFDGIKRNCKGCRLQGNVKEAMNVCNDCANLALCNDCTLIHSKNKATQYHVVTSLLETQTQGDLIRCEKHEEPFESFCCDCSLLVCQVCVLFEHGDHFIKVFRDACRDGIVEVETVIREEENRLKSLKADFREVTSSSETTIKMKFAILKGIDDHAHRCVETIETNKEDLKKRVKEHFEVVKVLNQTRKDLMKMIEQSEKAIPAAKSVLIGAEIRPEYLKKLTEAKVKERLGELKVHDPEYAKNKKRCREGVEKTELRFYPKTPNLNIGGLEYLDSYDLQKICEGKRYCTCEVCGLVKTYRACCKCKVLKRFDSGNLLCITCWNKYRVTNFLK